MEDLGDGLSAAATPRVAVIGAGWAGLAAAVTLCSRGVPVTVFEASRNLGGRARRVDIEGVALDNGQHILLGAYRDTLALMRKVGVDVERSLLRLPLELRYADGFRLRTPRLPYPFNLLAGFITARGLSMADGVAAGRFLLRLIADDFQVVPDQPVTAWLEAHGQRGALRERLWEPLCVSALNTPAATASARVFARVLRDGLTGSGDASDLLLAAGDLGALFPEPAARYVEAHGGEVRLGTPVRSIARDGEALFVDADSTAFSHVVVACGPQHASALMASFPELLATAALVDALDYEPIVTCYLQYEAPFALPAPMLGFQGGIAQWIFDRGRLGAQAGLIAAVISASGPHEELSRDALAQQVDTELRSALPDVPALKWSRVITEKRATFSCRASLTRPGTVTAVPGVYLAGDYVASAYPGTLEAAVQSGLAAAAHIARS